MNHANDILSSAKKAGKMGVWGTTPTWEVESTYKDSPEKFEKKYVLVFIAAWKGPAVSWHFLEMVHNNVEISILSVRSSKTENHFKKILPLVRSCSHMSDVDRRGRSFFLGRFPKTWTSHRWRQKRPASSCKAIKSLTRHTVQVKIWLLWSWN